jgi:hypothetical protein
MFIYRKRPKKVDRIRSKRLTAQRKAKFRNRRKNAKPDSK